MNAISFLIFHDRLYHMVWNNLLPVKLKFRQEIKVQDVGNLSWNLTAPAYKNIKVYQSIYIVYILLQTTRWSDLKLIQVEKKNPTWIMLFHEYNMNLSKMPSFQHYGKLMLLSVVLWWP